MHIYQTELNEEKHGSIANSNPASQVFIEGFQDNVLLHRSKKSTNSIRNSIKKSKREKRTNTWRGNSASPRRGVDVSVSQEMEWQTSERGSGDDHNHSDDEDDDDVVHQLFSGAGSAGDDLPDYEDGEANYVNIPSHSIDTVNPEWRKTLESTYSNPNTYQEKKDSIHHHLGDDSIVKNSNVRWNLMKPPASDTFPKDRGKSHILLSSDQMNKKLSQENRNVVQLSGGEVDKTSFKSTTEVPRGDATTSSKPSIELSTENVKTSTKSATELSEVTETSSKSATEMSDKEGKASTKTMAGATTEDAIVSYDE